MLTKHCLDIFFMLFCPLDLTLEILPKKACFCYFFWSYHFLPKLANLLHGYIRHIRDIMQHYEWRRQKTKVVQSAGLKRRSGAGAILVTLWGANGCRAFCVTKIVLAQLSSLLVQPSRCNHCDRRERTNLKKTDFRIFCATKTTLTNSYSAEAT